VPIKAQELRKIPFLSSVDDRGLQSLAGSMGERTVSAGENLVSQGEGGIAFFVVLDGEATVTIDGEHRHTLHAGDYFGEIALIARDAPRTATVTADTDIRVGTLTSWNFKPFVLEHPQVGWAMLELLARRIVDSHGA
jgi:CRP-like cAMP-binding protein